MMEVYITVAENGAHCRIVVYYNNRCIYNSSNQYDKAKTRAHYNAINHALIIRDFMVAMDVTTFSNEHAAKELVDSFIKSTNDSNVVVASITHSKLYTFSRSYILEFKGVVTDDGD